VSVVIPVYNEEEVLPALFDRLYPVLDALGEPCEVIFVNDGSRDRSAQMLAEQYRKRPDVTRVVLFNGNFGQHMAIMAGFERVRGRIAITLDADLQNPPEEIPRLLAAIDAGHDVVGTWRAGRADPAVRRAVSAGISWLVSQSVGVDIRDCGSMLRAYRRDVVEQVLRSAERAPFIPVLAASVARAPVDIASGHAARHTGRSRYSLLRFMRLGFDVMTGFSMMPIQVVSLVGIAVALAGVGFGGFLFVRRLIVGPESEGVFTLFAILFVFVGVLIFAVGVVGEYVGRIYLEVRGRPSYVVREIHRPED
jgi:undecaprenyl-phosphate 4-deoxy-4-formamido-L-arabinose transferase